LQRSPFCSRKLFAALILLLLLHQHFHAQDRPSLTRTADNVADGKSFELDNLGWRYLADDNSTSAERQLDDSAWETVKNTAIKKDSLPQSGWNGIGWFRLHLNVEPELANVPLNLEMQHLGASEIFLDGKLLGKYGTVGRTRATEHGFDPNRQVLGIVFSEGGTHTIAVRYSNQAASNVKSGWGRWLLADRGIGFQSRLTRLDKTTNNWTYGGIGYGFWVSQVAVCVTIGILHLLLFTFYPNQRPNLFYGLFVLAIALQATTAILVDYSHYAVTAYFFYIFGDFITDLLQCILLLAFLYTAFSTHIPRQIWLFIVGTAAFALLFCLCPGESQVPGYLLLYLLSIGMYVEASRIMIKALSDRIDGAWIVTLGIVIRALISVENLVDPLIRINTTLFFLLDVIGTYLLLLSISVYLVRNVARMHNKVELQQSVTG
jgi:hypothetical protein